MIAVFAKCKVQPGKEGEFLSLAHALAQESRKEGANLSYDILKESGKEGSEYFFLEKWQDQPGLDRHMQQPHFTDTISAVEKIIEGQLEIHVYENA
ncbi:MAG: antibiotic biosynthesis monooxygenase [Succinivibrionaceae bacterium]|nr:antibiotic biosynthesis monooxygenase [Succinivibrionaceae bacterium]